MMINPAKIYSTLGNPNSLVPLGVKDISSCVGMTAGSYATGKEEGFDRFIDEFGTEALWLGGIPSLKWLYDKTVFKAFGLDAKIDPRNLKDMEMFEKVKKYAPTDEVKKNLEKAGKNKRLFKNLAATKFFASTIVAAGAYIGLTKLKQYYTDQKIRKNLIKEYQAEVKKKEAENKQDVTKAKEPSFKGLGKIVEEFAFSPVKNMYILDGFITTERLKDSRTSQEFVGYAIKEGSILIFLYYAGKKMQQFMENSAKKNHNKSITLDSRVLESENLKKIFQDGSIEKSIKAFNDAKSSNGKLYEFLHENPDNEVVKIAKQSDILTTYKKTNKIDSRAFVDFEEVKGVNDKLSELYGQYKDAIKKGESTDSFFNKVRKLKRNSINMNIGACILALGVITPAIMLLKRMTDKSGPEFQTKKEIKEQLIKEGIIQA